MTRAVLREIVGWNEKMCKYLEKLCNDSSRSKPSRSDDLFSSNTTDDSVSPSLSSPNSPASSVILCFSPSKYNSQSQTSTPSQQASPSRSSPTSLQGSQGTQLLAYPSSQANQYMQSQTSTPLQQSSPSQSLAYPRSLIHPIA